MRVFGLLVLVLAAEGCAIVASDDGPTNKKTARVAAGPEVFPNSVKYADTGRASAIGRSGSASLMTRALLGKDGRTLLEVTTGELDATSPASGTLARVQLKTLDSSGEYATISSNSPGSGGFAKYMLDGLARFQPLQLQANVTGIDGARTDVVTVADAVRLRPDVAVTGLFAPDRVRILSNAVISASIFEKNGDVGARGDCVLSVDGVETDRAKGIWVDAGGKVSCAFTHAFDVAGSHTVTVSVGSVVPGDYDLENNSASTTVQVDAPIEPVTTRWYMSARDEASHQHALTEWWYTAVGFRLAGHAESTSDQNAQTTFFSVTSDTGLDFPLSVSFSDSTDATPIGSGELVLSGTETIVKGDPKSGLQTKYTCGRAYLLVSDSTVEACSREDTLDGVVTRSSWSTLARFGGDATYYSLQYGLVWGVDLGVRADSWSRHAKPLALGSRYNAKLTVHDDAHSMSGDGFVMLFPYEYAWSQPYTCRSWQWPDKLWGNICDQYESSQKGRSGFRSFDPTPPPPPPSK